MPRRIGAILPQIPLAQFMVFTRRTKTLKIAERDGVEPGDRIIDVCRKMYDRYPKFGEKITGMPNRIYMAEVHMGNDRELFTEDGDGMPVFEGL